MNQDPLPEGEVRTALERVLEREGIPEVEAGEHPFFAWLAEQLGEGGPAFKVVVAVGMVVALGFLVFLWRRRIRQSQGGPERARTTARSERVEGLRAQARTAEESGDARLALRLYFQALMAGLGESGDLEYRAAWTLREILERGRPAPAVRERLESALLQVEPRSFGGRLTTAEDVAHLRGLCDELLGRHRERAA